jgi:hypothetical protein
MISVAAVSKYPMELKERAVAIEVPWIFRTATPLRSGFCERETVVTTPQDVFS